MPKYSELEMPKNKNDEEFEADMMEDLEMGEESSDLKDLLSQYSKSEIEAVLAEMPEEDEMEYEDEEEYAEEDENPDTY
jgi:hypothetical protein